MLRILSPSGKVFEAGSVVPVVEKEVKFNGGKKRLFGKAQGFAQKPTGIVFYPNQCNMAGENARLYVGNMRPEKVESLMREMLSQGYCDLSTIKYQTSKGYGSQIIDGGESPAYNSEDMPECLPMGLDYGFSGFGGIGGFGANDVFSNAPAFDDASDEDECGEDCQEL